MHQPTLHQDERAAPALPLVPTPKEETERNHPPGPSISTLGRASRPGARPVVRCCVCGVCVRHARGGSSGLTIWLARFIHSHRRSPSAFRVLPGAPAQ
eukprot:1552983-Prymnesium_polylepis.3